MKGRKDGRRKTGAAPRGTRSGLLAAGNFALDYVALIDRYPAEDTIAQIWSSTMGNGGPPYNALVDLAHLKAPFPLQALGLLGDDAEGRHILAHCKRLGIDTRRLRSISSAGTSYSEIMTVQATGGRTIFHHRGANVLLDDRHFDFDDTRAKILHLAFIALLDALDRPSALYGTVAAGVLARARASGIITAADVVSDASGRLPGLVAPALPHLDYFFVNEIEAELITGIRARVPAGPEHASLDRGLLEDAGRAIVARGLSGWLILHTADGVLALRRGESPRWQGSVLMPPAEIVGTNGAGDAFAAGFLYGVHEDRPIEEALRIGVCVAAASLTDSTPSAGVRPLAACLRLGARHGYRESAAPRPPAAGETLSVAR